MHLYQFERLLEDFEPALYCHLHRRQVTPHLYATQWFLTLFAYRFPLQLVLRIYDLILSEGLEAIIKFGIVLMQKNAATLLGMSDMVALTNFLKDRVFDVYIDQAPSAGSILESGFFGSSGASIDKEVYRADQLIQDACAVKITPELLKTYKLEWEEKTRLEKEREAELEHLKSTNHSLQQKVRRLEERVEEHDSEHAALATDLVKTKVENEELNDENESLKVQVRELRLVIEKQPEEVEARLQSEMDRLMKRNQEVHEENTRLEEEMGEMEQTLVATKMQYAEVFLPIFLTHEAQLTSMRSTLPMKPSRENGPISAKHLATSFTSHSKATAELLLRPVQSPRPPFLSFFLPHKTRTNQARHQHQLPHGIASRFGLATHSPMIWSLRLNFKFPASTSLMNDTKNQSCDIPISFSLFFFLSACLSAVLMGCGVQRS